MADSEIRLTVLIPTGLHARPAAALAEFLEARIPGAKVCTLDDRIASGESVLEIMLLGVKQGDPIWIRSLTGIPLETRRELEVLVGAPPRD